MKIYSFLFIADRVIFTHSKFLKLSTNPILMLVSCGSCSFYPQCNPYTPIFQS